MVFILFINNQQSTCNTSANIYYKAAHTHTRRRMLCSSSKRSAMYRR